MIPLSPTHAALLSEVLSAFLITESIDLALQNVLELVGCHFKVSRVYICENSDDETSISTKYQWTDIDISPSPSNTKNITPGALSSYYARFDTNHMFYLSDITAENGKFKEILEQNSICSLLQAAFICNDRPFGFVGLDDCLRKRVWTLEEISFLSMLAQLISVFLLNARTQRRSLMGEELLFKILDHVAGLNYIIDIQTHELLYFSKALHKVSPEVQLGQHCYTFFHMEQKVPCPFCPVRAYLADPSIVATEFDYYNQRYNLWMHVRSRIFEWYDGRMVCLLNSLDLSDKRQFEQKIEALTFTDKTTGLANRRCFEKKAPALLEQARNDGQQVAVVAVKLESLHHINSTRGHKRGDVLLKGFAQHLQRLVPGTGFFARVRGNDFILLYPFDQDKSKPHVQAFMQRLYESFDGIETPGSLKGWLTVSCGISLFPLDGEHIEDLHRMASLAIPASGTFSKTSYAFYDSTLMARLFERDQLSKDLARAITEGELEVFHQPKHDLRLSRIGGTEALVRWRHPNLGLLDGGAFIPLAEELNLMAAIDQWVLFESCRQIRVLLDKGVPMVPVSINISPDKFYQNDILEQLQQAITTYNIPPELVEVELTERLALENLEQAAKIMRHIRKMGIKISIDDFGTGYSSLNYLRMIPFDVIKVDRTFAADIETNLTAQGIVQTIVGLARLLNATVVFEGIENAEQYQFARQAGCTMVQGFYTDRPMPLDQLETKLVAQGVQPSIAIANLSNAMLHVDVSVILSALLILVSIGSFAAILTFSPSTSGILLSLGTFLAGGGWLVYHRHRRLKRHMETALSELIQACKKAWRDDQTSLAVGGTGGAASAEGNSLMVSGETGLLADVSSALGTTLLKFHEANAAVQAHEHTIAELEQQVQTQNEQYRTIVKKYRIVSEAFRGVIWELDLRNHIMVCSPSFTLRFGHEQCSFSYPENFSKLIHPDDRDTFYNGVESALHGNINKFEMVIRLCKADGSYHWINCNGEIMYDSAGNAESFVGAFEGLDDMPNQYVQNSPSHATLDPLTDISNNLSGKLILAQKLRESSCLCTLLFIDINNFYHTNENYGKLCGDTILRNLAHRLSRVVTSEDVLFRHGSDAFVLFLANGRRADTVKAWVGEILNIVNAPYHHLHNAVNIRCSVGAVFTPPFCHEATVLLAKAKQAQELAVQTGEGYVIDHTYYDNPQPHDGAL